MTQKMWHCSKSNFNHYAHHLLLNRLNTLNINTLIYAGLQFQSPEKEAFSRVHFMQAPGSLVYYKDMIKFKTRKYGNLLVFVYLIISFIHAWETFGSDPCNASFSVCRIKAMSQLLENFQKSQKKSKPYWLLLSLSGILSNHRGANIFLNPSELL